MSNTGYIGLVDTDRTELRERIAVARGGLTVWSATPTRTLAYRDRNGRCNKPSPTC